MTRREVKTFIQAGINALNQGIAYGTGRISEFNSDRMLSYPHIWLEPLIKSTNIENQILPYDTWTVKLNVAKKDAADSAPDEYEDLVDDCDAIAGELLIKLNQIVSGYKTVRLDNIGTVPFIKKHADCLTGVVLEFSIIAPDTTNTACD